jgi:redox-sensitive bicupin YhaK (pirin superfamily)
MADGGRDAIHGWALPLLQSSSSGLPKTMISLRKSQERRHTSSGGQDTWATFDFENSSDPLRGGFRTLETLNEEGLAPGSGFTLQPEKDLEILTYVFRGALMLEDPAGGTRVLEAGECGRSSARIGTPLRSFNGSLTDRAHVFQCRFTANRSSLKTQADKRRFPLAERRGVLRLILSPDGRNESLQLRQNARIYSSILDSGHHVVHELGSGRAAWLHVVSGRILLIDHILSAGDGASLVDEAAVSLTAQEPSEILLFDLL